MSHEVDEPHNHENGVEVELLGRVLLPGEGERRPIGGVEPDDPEEDEADDAV